MKNIKHIFAIDVIKEVTMFRQLLLFKMNIWLEKMFIILFTGILIFLLSRQGVTYEDKFKILENWENTVTSLIFKVDFIVTKNKFNITDNRIKEQNIGDLNIYFIKSD